MVKKFFRFGKRYLLVLFVALFTYVALTTSWNNIKQSATTIALNNLESDAAVYTEYFDSIFAEKQEHLELFSKSVSADLFEDAQSVKQALADYRDVFNELAVYDESGELLYGDEIALDLRTDNILYSITSKRNDVIYSDTIKDTDNQEEFVLCSPVTNGSVIMGVVVGTVTVDELNTLLDSWGDSLNGCAVVITEKGKYLTAGDNFDTLLGGEVNSFFTYLSRSKISSGDMTVTKVEKTIQEGEQVVLQYRYLKENYFSVLSPSACGSWYLAYIEKVADFYEDSFALSAGGVVAVSVAVLLWVVLLVCFAYSVYCNGRYREELQRYDIIHSQEHSLIFEFTFSPKHLEFFGNIKKITDEDKNELSGEEVYEVYQYIHPDDRSVRGRIHTFYDTAAPGSVFTAEMRIGNSEGVYEWHRMTASLVKDKHTGENLKFIGKIEDAQEAITEEKNLVQRAENDLLTGVLNKTTMQERTSQAIQGLTGNDHCIFFMVDLDNFKNVNDKLGHIWGDKAIVDTANRLTELFHENAFVGRLGGDEFAVCAIYDAFDKESLLKYIEKKAGQICEVNRRSYGNNEITVDVTSSVGVAIAPEFATDWESIYRMSDSALYDSKNGGKNCYHIYNKKA